MLYMTLARGLEDPKLGLVPQRCPHGSLKVLMVGMYATHMEIYS